MKSQKVDYVWLLASSVSFLLLAISFLLMPIDGGNNTAEGISFMSLMAGLLFWLSIVCGVVTQLVLTHRINSWLTANRIRRGKVSKRIGIVSFFQNPFAIAADIAMIMGGVGLVISYILTDGIGFVCYAFLALFVFSFSMHCILNGKTYYVIQNKGSMQKAVQKERANQSEK